MVIILSLVPSPLDLIKLNSLAKNELTFVERHAQVVPTRSRCSTPALLQQVRQGYRRGATAQKGTDIRRGIRRYLRYLPSSLFPILSIRF